MILKLQKLVEQINVSFRFKLINLILLTLQCIFSTIKGPVAEKIREP